MQTTDKAQQALDYHQFPVPGKLSVVPSKPVANQADLSLAYSPGVAVPCTAIAENKADVYRYTNRGNLVAVISNGTAVLGLGNIGPEASKPVMEGKAVLFKKFAGIDSFDIEINATDPDEVIRVVKALEPTFGGINLEDIKAPECFYIEEELKKQVSIPLMHDDQHGTAIISGAALLNALEIIGKKIEDIKIVVIGGGAAAIACAKFYLILGVNPDNMVMLNTKGVIRKDKTDPSDYRYMFATSRDITTLEEAMQGADVVLGLARADLLTPEHLLSMAANPIVFALSNPNPEIAYELAISTRPDVMMATGRSDYPNQVNNVLGFPFIFRGALDVRATAINEAMKMAAAQALASLAKEAVPEVVKKAYNRPDMAFGSTYLIPTPLDPRLMATVAVAVAKAAIESGVAQAPITDWDAYTQRLQQLVG